MDFLDPKAKSKRNIRLAIGYSLMAVLISFATLILLYQAYGFNFDRKSGVVQNGLVFFDSAPNGAEIYLNGEKNTRQTNVRLSVPEGDYSVELRKQGYRSWFKDLTLTGGFVERLYYPLLVPETLTQNAIANYSTAPHSAMQSPDKRWVLVNDPESFRSFTRYDLNSLDRDSLPTSRTVSYPANLFKSSPGDHQIELVEWSTNNKSLLIKHVFKGGFEYIVLNHDKPSESINISTEFNRKLEKVTLLDKSPDKFYFYFQKQGLLQTAELKSKRISTILTSVTSFKSHGDNDLLYARKSADKSAQEVVLKLGDDEYVIHESRLDSKLTFDLARYDNRWYAVVSVKDENKAYVYKNPQDYLRDKTSTVPVPITVLKLGSGAEHLSFSQNARMIMASTGQEFSVFDAEYERTFGFKIKNKFDAGSKPVWMDGHRLVAHSGGKALIFEFDGKNRQLLINAKAGFPVMFDRDYERMYSLGLNDKKLTFTQTPLRLPNDL